MALLVLLDLFVSKKKKKEALSAFRHNMKQYVDVCHL